MRCIFYFRIIPPLNNRGGESLVAIILAKIFFCEQLENTEGVKRANKKIPTPVSEVGNVH